jgi:hypothetical protein
MFSSQTPAVGLFLSISDAGMLVERMLDAEVSAEFRYSSHDWARSPDEM